MKLTRFDPAGQEWSWLHDERARARNRYGHIQDMTPLSLRRDSLARAAGPDLQRRLRLGRARWLVACAAAPLASCERAGVLDPQGPIASAERLLLINSTAIMLVVVIPVILATLGFAWWYRSSNPRASRRPEVDYEGRIEFVTWSIPALIVILLAGVIWIGSHQLDPRAPIQADAPPLDVEVVALDWKWLFIYPDENLATVNELIVPAGRPLQFRLTSATVMNSFFIPQLGSQIYAMGGMTTHLNLLAEKPGEYPGLSAMFSGDGFSGMHFLVKAVTPQAFESWVGQVRGSASALDDASYAALAKPSEDVAPISYGSVAPRLFDHIVEQTASGHEKPTGASLRSPVQDAGG
jgi:cytochrome o ubiquinol oxidase subunit II